MGVKTDLARADVNILGTPFGRLETIGALGHRVSHLWSVQRAGDLPAKIR